MVLKRANERTTVSATAAKKIRVGNCRLADFPFTERGPEKTSKIFCKKRKVLQIYTKIRDTAEKRKVGCNKKEPSG